MNELKLQTNLPRHKLEKVNNPKPTKQTPSAKSEQISCLYRISTTTTADDRPIMPNDERLKSQQANQTQPTSSHEVRRPPCPPVLPAAVLRDAHPSPVGEIGSCGPLYHIASPAQQRVSQEQEANPDEEIVHFFPTFSDCELRCFVVRRKKVPIPARSAGREATGFVSDVHTRAWLVESKVTTAKQTSKGEQKTFKMTNDKPFIWEYQSILLTSWGREWSFSGSLLVGSVIASSSLLLLLLACYGEDLLHTLIFVVVVVVVVGRNALKPACCAGRREGRVGRPKSRPRYKRIRTNEGQKINKTISALL